MGRCCGQMIVSLRPHAVFAIVLFPSLGQELSGYARQATLSADEAARHARTSLDGYVNQVYRCVKSRRDGFADAALLDELESVPWLLETVFALHGRLRPYNKYLRWELERFPLPDPWNEALRPGQVGAASLRLFPAMEALVRRRGHGDVLDEWGSDIELIRRLSE